MAKNDYLARQKAMQKAVFEVAEEIGMQRMWDALQLVLRNPKYVGKDIHGRSRLEKIYEGVKDTMSEYYKAFSNDVEADYTQEKLDEALREIWGEDLEPFDKRYPAIKQPGYEKSRKGWT
jgi:hypothetical protein